MSNFDRAVEALDAVDIYIDHLTDNDANDAYVTALEAAGLLAPDLPKANDPGIFVPSGKGWRMGEISVWTAPDSPVMIQNVEPGDLSPTSTRELAYALLAAADYAEKEQDNE